MVMWMYCCVPTLITLSALLQSWQVLSQPHHGGQQEEHEHHGKPLQFSSEVHNVEHVREHLQKVVVPKPKEHMTEEELEFYYFKIHDYDNNNKLDGVEIGKALTHYHDENDKTGDNTQMTRVYSDDELSEIIDAALASEDLDGDGYVEYPEFMTSLARSAGDRDTEKFGPPGGAHPTDHEPGWEARPPGV